MRSVSARARHFGSPAFVRRLGLGVADQICSSGSNFGATLVAARLLPAVEFGSFSVVMVSYLFALGLNRGVTCEVILVRPGDDAAEQRLRARRALTASLLVGALSGVLLWIAAAMTNGPLSHTLLVAGAVLPLLLAQDCLRYAAFSRNEPSAALVSDGIWIVGLVVSFGALVGSSARVTPAWVLASWAAPGILGWVVQAWRDRVRPLVRSGAGWIVEHRDLSYRYALDFVSLQGAGHLGTYVLMVVSGLAAVGGLRGAQTVFGPLSILLTGTYVVLVPEGRRAVERSKRSLTVMCVASSLAFAVAAFAVLATLLLLSPAEGELLLGSTWGPARSLLVPIGLANAVGGLYAGATAGLRAMAAARSLLRVRLLTMPTTIALPVLGAVLHDASGMAYGLVAAEVVAIAWYVPAYRRELAAYGTVAPADDDEGLQGLDEPAPLA